MEPKLVRDHIPDIIRASGAEPSWRQLGNGEYLKALHAKLREEVDEYFQAPDDASRVAELVDVLEVVRSLAAMHGVDADGLERKRADKARVRGGFSERIYLIDVG